MSWFEFSHVLFLFVFWGVLLRVFLGAFAYQRSGQTFGQRLSTRFLNSGCVIGAVWALRDLFYYMNLHSYSINDDQQLYIRYLHTHPDLIHVDNKMDFMLTSYKQYQFNYDAEIPETPDQRKLFVTHDLALCICDKNYTQIFNNILIFHANNRKSSVIYAMINYTYQAVVQSTFPKERRSQLIKDLWKRVDEKRLS